MTKRQVVPPRRARLAPEDRRRELVGIGLELLLTRPLNDLSIDEVAARAGISRSLLFHYYPTKRDYLAAVVRAAARRFLFAAEAGGAGVLPPTPGDGAAPAPERVSAMLESLLTWVERRREPYVWVLRAAAADDQLGEAYGAAQDELARRVLAALGRDPSDPLHLLLTRGWLAMVQEMAVRWVTDPTPLPRDTVLFHLRASLDAALPPLLETDA